MKLAILPKIKQKLDTNSTKLEPRDSRVKIITYSWNAEHYLNSYVKRVNNKNFPLFFYLKYIIRKTIFLLIIFIMETFTCTELVLRTSISLGKNE